MHLLPAKLKTNRSRVNIKNEIDFFYLCILTITALFLSVFAFKLQQINLNVLGVKTESVTNEIEITIQTNFWKEFTSQNPGYYDGWMELYNLTEEDTYLLKAKAIDPNR
jgi:hypothetical protein